MNPNPAWNNRWLKSLVNSKFCHLVTAQLYGAQRNSADIKERWAARGVVGAVGSLAGCYTCVHVYWLCLWVAWELLAAQPSHASLIGT